MPATIQSRRYGLRALAAWLDARGVLDVRQLGRAEVDAYVASVRAPKVKAAPHTIEGRIGALKGFFRFLVDTNRILLSPAEHVRERNLSHLVGPTMTVAQAQKLLAAPNTSLPHGVRDRALLELLYGTGLRRDEVGKLSIFDVDLAGGLVRVNEGKGGKARVVPLGSQAAHWLGLYLEHVRPRLAGRRHARTDRHTLFLGRSGEELSGPGLGKIVDAAARAAGVRASCHMLRRTMATELLRGGADIITVARILGHASPQTTQRYTKVETTDLRLVHARHHPRGA
jgi:integrase/recombinase XerD